MNAKNMEEYDINIDDDGLNLNNKNSSLFLNKPSKESTTDLSTEEAAPSLFPSSSFNNQEINQKEKKTKIDFSKEINKLMLKRCSFFYNTKGCEKKIDKIILGKNTEIKYNQIIQNEKNYNKKLNIYQYYSRLLIEYVEEVFKRVNKINKNKINFDLVLKFKNEENNKNNENAERQNNYNNDSYNITCKYIFLYKDKNGILKIKKKYVHNNIFDDITQLTKIKEILNEIEELLNKISENNDKLNEEIIIEKKDKDKNINKIRKIHKLNNSNLKLISFKKIIATHENSAQMIIEMPCGFFVSCGLDGQIILYDENLNEIYKEKIIDNWIYSISLVPNSKNQFMACCPEKIFLVTIKEKDIDLEYKKLNIKNSLNFYSFSTKEDEIIFCGNKSITQYNGIIQDITLENKNNSINILNEFYATNGTKITDNIISAVSNKVLNNGKDVLKYINTNNANELSINDYSFNISQNSLLKIISKLDIKSNSIIPENQNKKSKRNKKNKKQISTQNNREEKAILLLAGCTKYLKDQKNGILILCPNGKEIQDNFYDTGDFEVFCFCLVDKKNKIDNNKHYLFVGGYDNYLSQGLIKLYEIIYDESQKIEFTKLKFKRNIPNLSRFKQPINCIIQSSKTGEIVVTSWDGTVNLFSKPELD